MRGVDHINVGFIQNVRWTRENSAFADNYKEVSVKQSNIYWLDQDLASSGPWTDSNNIQAHFSNGPLEFWSTKQVQKSPVTANLATADTPIISEASTTYSLIGQGSHGALLKSNIVFDALDYLAASTTDSVSNSQMEFAPLAQGSWSFNGSGYNIGETFATKGKWVPIAANAVSGDTSLSSNVADIPVTSGANAVVIARNINGWYWLTPNGLPA